MNILNHVFFLAILTTTSLQAREQSPIGFWSTEENKAKVEIYKCGPQGQHLCGKIRQLKEPLDAEKKPKVDPKGKPILDMEILKGLKLIETNKWGEGQIYDPKEGSTYNLEVTLEEGGQKIYLRGYIGIPILGKTQTWVRITKDTVLR